MKHKTLWGLVLALGGLFGALLFAQPLQDPLFHSFRDGDPSWGIYFGTQFPSIVTTGTTPPDGVLFLERAADAGDQPRLWIYSDAASAWNALLQVTGGAGTDERHVKFDGVGGIENSNFLDSAANVFMAAQGYIFTDSSTNTNDHVRVGIGSVLWEGTANNFETEITVTDPTVDNTVTLPNYNVNTVGTVYPLVSIGATNAIPEEASAVWADADVLYIEGNTENGAEFLLTVADPNADVTLTFDSPAAGASGVQMQLTGTFLAMDGAGDVVDSFLIDVAHGAHTAGTHNAIRIDNVGGAAATHNALHIEAGFDVAILADDVMTLSTPGDIDLTTTDTGDIDLNPSGSVEVTAGVLILPDGAVGAPSLTWSGHTTTGIYQAAANTIDFTTAGTLRWTVTAAGQLSSRVAGSAAAPEISLGTEDWDSGFYGIAANNIGVAVGGALVMDWEDTNAAAAGADLTTISSTLGIMDDATDFVRGLYVNLTNVNHTGGNVYGLDLATSGQDPQAVESAIRYSSGWDYLVTTAEAATALQSSNANPSWSFVDTATTRLRFRADAGGTVSWNALELDPLTNGMDGGDTLAGIFIDLAEVNHGGGALSNTTHGVWVDDITVDADAITYGMRVETGWDAALMSDGIAHAALRAAGNGAMVFCTNCDPASTPCTTGGASTGAFAFRVNGQWDCPW